MWRITIIANDIMMVLFWLLSVLSVSIADNRFVQYSEGEVALPMVTKLALSIQFWIGLIPLSWIILSCLIWKKVQVLQPGERNENILAFTAATIVIGLSLIAFYVAAGILPFLYIGMVIK
jgi:hypothetical protein